MSQAVTEPAAPSDISLVPSLGDRYGSGVARSDERNSALSTKSVRVTVVKVRSVHSAPARPSVMAPTASPPPDPNVKPVARAPLPVNSGDGHRVVFDITGQQVWLVDEANTVVRTYLVSGSRFDQLPTGVYEVFSTSRHAISWHGTQTMEYMVRFYRGHNSNIGFHDIPVDSVTGQEIQTLSQLGTPLSDGCIRQDVVDAIALWQHAPVGTKVVVVRS
jgi:lipoprotein-anchoring transpeptidase ErfK/SrfK